MSSDFINNCLAMAAKMHSHQSLANRETADDGRANLVFVQGKTYGREALALVRGGQASPYFLTVVFMTVAGTRDEALIHGLCAGLQEGA